MTHQSVKYSLYKTTVDCLPENSSSRHSTKITRKLRSHYSPVLSCACSHDSVQISILYADLHGESTTCLKLIPYPEDHFQATCNHHATSAGH
ncbi:hypothetical protein TNCV_1660321 [Trichonephila clavipes]|nr:hypothetical protein TNCV_1660321 [Trichonephila clavipes]